MRIPKTIEPFWWSLFSAGGVIAAFLTPITIILTGIAIPFGWISAESLYNVIHHPLARLYLFLLIAPTLFHGAHRTLFTLIDLGMKNASLGLSVALYGGAIAGSLAAAFLLVRL